MSEGKIPFVHLHVHSHYSLLDGAIPIYDERHKSSPLIDTAKQYGMPSVALTDHGNLYGAMEFYEQATSRGVKPIIGYEGYVAPGSRFDKSAATPPTYHLTILVRNERGYRNLMNLASAASLEGFYYKPRIDKELLEKYADGLLVLSGCLKGEIGQSLLGDHPEEAEKIARSYRDLFGKENFYLEIQDNGLEDQKKLLPRFRALSQTTRIPLVATSDIHYLHRDDAKAHDVLLCIGTQKLLDDPNRLRFQTSEFYFRSGEEMARVFADFPEAIENTVAIAGRCDLEFKFGEYHLPEFVPPEGLAPKEYLRKLCYEGIPHRYPVLSGEIKQRLEHELAVIEKTGFVSYFLIVWDFIYFAKTHGVPVGPGRGSGTGSIVAYLLNITDIDPLRWNLLFERFLNSDRISMPDLDIDFCTARRDKVIAYVREKYGQDNVCQIVTFGTLGAKGVIRDVGRVLNVPLPEVDAITKKIPPGPNVHLKRSLGENPDLRAMYESDPAKRELFDLALKLEGLARHPGVHAAGVVISDKPLTQYLPLCKNGDEITTQYPMEVLEKIGLLKMDFLGLKTLTIIDKAQDFVEKATGRRPSLEAIPLDDPKVFALYGRGDTKGVFQVESSGFRELLTRMKPDSLEDIIAAVAIFRPGPLEAEVDKAYIKRKHREEPVAYLHPLLVPILQETYGTIVYQEQVMAISNQVGGFTLNEGDNLRKAMGKKKPEVMARFRAKFIAGAGTRKVDEKVAEEIWNQMESFSRYGFNKCHSAAYALLSYQTAYFKTHHPVAYMAALLSCEAEDTDKVSEYADDARAMGLAILPPDVNASGFDFSVAGDRIRFGLGAVKNVGTKAIDEILAARQRVIRFSSVFHFAEQVDLRVVNKTVWERLIQSGAFDSLGGHRAQVLAGLDKIMSLGSLSQADRKRGQKTFFSTPAASPAVPDCGPGTPGGSAAQKSDLALLPPVPPWLENELLAREKQALGFYLSSHPLARHADLLQRYSRPPIEKWPQGRDGEEIVVGGMIKSIRPTLVKNGRSKGQQMALLQFEDLTGVAAAVIFSDLFAKVEPLLREDAILFFKGKLDLSREQPSIKVAEVVTLERAQEELTSRVSVNLEARNLEDKRLEELKKLFLAHPGTSPVYLKLKTAPHQIVCLRTASEYAVTPNEAFLKAAERLLGPGHVVLQ